MADPQLETFRSSIDNIDAALILLLAERFKITKAVGEYKAAAGLPAAAVAGTRAAATASGSARIPRASRSNTGPGLYQSSPRKSWSVPRKH